MHISDTKVGPGSMPSIVKWTSTAGFSSTCSVLDGLWCNEGGSSASGMTPIWVLLPLLLFVVALVVLKLEELNWVSSCATELELAVLLPPVEMTRVKELEMGYGGTTFSMKMLP